MNELLIILREGVDLQRREEIPTPLIEEIDAWIERAEDAIERHTTPVVCREWPRHLDRQFVRALLKFTQMDAPTEDQISILHGYIARRLIAFQGMSDTYRVADIFHRSIRVKSHYFDDREGVTFSDDFVGFAGWADENHIQPILWAVIDWVKEVTGYDGSDKLMTDFVEGDL